MNREAAEKFACEWLEAWNAHDLDRILSHYTEDFEMSSPVITKVTGNPDGRLQGKVVVGRYWAKALELFPTLKFIHICTLLGVNSVAIHYYGATGKRVAEVFNFNEAGLVYRAHAHYE
jgi:hypothetical protein